MATSTTIEEFTAEARSFLEAHAERRPPAKEFVWGQGSDDVGMFDEKDRAVEAREAEEAKAWRRQRFDHGFGWITGPEQFGGRALPQAYERAYNSVESQYRTPNMGVFTISLGMVAPTILAHAVPEVQELYLRDLYRGDLVACQLFSEPGAGSDLAGVGTRAVRDGDEWVVSGQKVWTSAAHLSQIGEVICRTDPDLPKHRGLTGFVIDMHAPGVEVRPLRQMTGGAAFNEVFFDGLRVPDDHRLGDVNGGWAVALTTLLNERASIGAGSGGGGLGGLGNAARLIEMLRHFDLDRDPLLRQELAAVYSGFQVAKWNGQRAMDKVKAGQAPGPELSGAKLSLTRNLQAVAEFAGHVLGPRMVADTGEWGTYAWGQFVCGVPGMRVAGGTDEVLKKIISEQVLGLPKDVGIDTTSPFKDLPKS
ncbi:MAG TPA: acyl-CoA dehydrogenase family protein [Acidimicrobiales bacterium]|nr:acyl-CoA dehydrogenase family protein [Acidimicrobiales bacterium]